jgi:hypothetical protein
MNRILAYEETDNETPPPKIDIYQAIHMASQAWNNVKQSTIKHSWTRAGILSPIFYSQISDILPIENNQDLILNEINELASQLPISDPLDSAEFITIDDNLECTEEITLEDCIAVVKHLEDDEEVEEETIQEIQISEIEALESIDKLTTYFRQQNYGIEDSFMKRIKGIRREILIKSQKNLRQSTLQEFVNLQ